MFLQQEAEWESFFKKFFKLLKKTVAVDGSDDIAGNMGVLSIHHC
jgi:hypothetical protein